MSPSGQPASPRERELFMQALEQPSREERNAFLDRACGHDSVLRRRLARLLEEFDRIGTFLDQPVNSVEDRAGLAKAPNGEAGGGMVLLPVTEKPGDRIGRYKLREKIGEGGCGIVYVAEQEEPVRRRVALKVIKLGMDTREVVARFEAERQALAMMDHPNIAKVFDAGATETGRPYFVMELVRGIRITDYCDQNKLSTQERLDLFIQVCHAIQHAHQKGIIHRDIKPSNVLVTLHDGVPVPKVIDFGIAKAMEQKLTEKTIYTAFEQFIGTPAYTSPEQAEMSGLDIDTRSDIYALGVLLYELLTGKTPFDGQELVAAGLEEMRRTIREKEPVRPSTRLRTMLNRDLTTTAQRRRIEAPKLISLLRGDLDWIVMKCLEKDRTRRYETANGLALDIERHLTHEPVAARPPSTAYRVQKFVRRNKVMVAAGGAVAAALALGIVGSTWQAVRAKKAEQEQSRERQRAEQSEKTEAAARKQAQANAYSAEMNLAQEAYAAGKVGRALALLERHIPGSAAQQDMRGFEWRYLWRLCQEGDALHTFSGYSNGAAVALSPQGRLVTCGSEGAVRTVRVFDVATKQEAARFQLSGEPNGAAISANGEVIAARLTNGAVRLCKTSTPDEATIIPGAGPVGRLALSSDGRILAMACTNRVRLWDCVDHRELKSAPWSRPLRLEWGLAFSLDSSVLASASAGVQVNLWSLSKERELDPLKSPHTSVTFGLAFSPDGRTLATGSWDTTLKLWDVASQQLLATLQGHRAAVWCLAFSPDGRTLASGSVDATVKLWD
ncbi:MAG: serine/threonine protein kinase, partial [Verrucomicrobia bacterium]|nr:serine/threonine protein kinase [Verrucomicrobiota bacterium]